MDLSIPLLTILGVIGYNMNTEVDKREYIEKRKKISDHENPSSKNAYESDTYRKVHADELKRAKSIKSVRNVNKALVNTNDPQKQKKEVKRVRFDLDSDEVGVNEQMVLAGGRGRVRSDEEIFGGPMFNVEKKFEDIKIASEFAKESFSNDTKSKLSGVETDFSHTNMVPFFGSKIKGGGSTAGVLSRYTGTDKPQKKEVMAAVNGKQETNGTQAFTTLVSQDRFNAGMYITGVLPYEQVREQPLPNEATRTLDKSVDELRTLSKPKTVLEGITNTGAAIGQRGIVGMLDAVSRGSLIYEQEKMNMGTSNNLKSGVIEDHNRSLRPSNKASTETQYGLMSAFDSSKGNYTGYTNTNDGSGTFARDPHRESYANDWVRNAKNPNELRRLDMTDNIHLRSQERETFKSENLGIATYGNKGRRVNTSDKPRVTNKQLNLYSYTGSANSQNIHMPESRDSYYTTELSDKALAKDHFTGGVAFGVPGIGKEDVNISWKERPTIENHFNPAKSNKKISTSKSIIGNGDRKDFYPQEHSFLDRLGA